MSTSYKPDGHSSVSPYLVADNPAGLVSFLEEVFAAQRVTVQDDAEGELEYAELRIDDSLIMVDRTDVGLPKRESVIHVYVEDVDNTHDRALEADAVSINAPKQLEGDPYRRAIFLGPEENIWAIASTDPDG